MRISLVALLFSFLPLGAQTPGGDERPETGSRWAAYALAAALGATGFVAGGFAAASASAANDDCEDLSCLEAAFYGAAALGTIGVSIGAHLGNGRRGSLPLDLAVAAGVWLAGIGPVIVSGDGDGPYALAAFVLVPVAQVLLTTEVERSRGRVRARSRRAAVSVGPLWATGPPGIVLRIGL